MERADEDSGLPQPLFCTSGRYRVRLPGSMAKVLGWDGMPGSFQCHCVFRTDGELLVCPVKIKGADGRHPLYLALAFRELHTLDEQPTALQQFPAPNLLALPFRVFGADASWTSAARVQLDLRLGSTVLSLLGWTKGEAPPIYPLPMASVLCLLSERRVHEAQRAGLMDFSDGLA